MWFLIICFFVQWGLTSSTAQPAISSDPRTLFAWEDKRATLQVTAIGTAPLRYQWQFQGADIAGETNRTLTIQRAQAVAEGDYRVLVSNPSGSITSRVARLMVRSWPRPTGPQVPQLARLDTNVQNVLQTYGVPGASLAVVKEGRLVFARGYGWADVEHEEQFQPDSVFRICSLSKTITAALLMKLVEEKKLLLEDRVLGLLDLGAATYPGATNDSRLTNITVLHLLKHTAGWDSTTAVNPLGTKGFDPPFWPDALAKDLQLTSTATPAEFVRWLLGKPLQRSPGSALAYSNNGYVVAGRVVEKVTGEPFEVAARKFLASLGITRIKLGKDSLPDRAANEAVNYFSPAVTPADIAVQYAEPKPVDFSLPYAYPITTFDAAGGFVASAIDFARFVAAIDGSDSFPDLLSTNSVRKMASDMLGWDVVDNPNPVTGIWWKGGGGPGATTRAVKWRNGIIFVFLLNSWVPRADVSISADDALYNSITASLPNLLWPTNNFFPVTLSYEAWRNTFFSPTELSDPKVAGDRADADGDGAPNLLEYAHGTDPRLPTAPPSLSTIIRNSESGGSFIVQLNRLPLSHEVSYDLEKSLDLQLWSPVTEGQSPAAVNPDGTLAVSVATSREASSRLFFRLRVSLKD